MKICRVFIAKAHEELERRKAANIEALRSFGFDI